jgi:Uri superfamily endonuclease
MRGAYVLIIDLKKNHSIHLKSLGDLKFAKGTWIYIGSAMGNGSTNLENRLRRHFRSEKTIHWHIDYLLNSDSRIRSSIWSESAYPVECEIAKSIESLEGIQKGPKRFGASDCKNKCWTHLYHSLIKEGLEGKIKTVFKNLNLNPKITNDGII